MLYSPPGLITRRASFGPLPARRGGRQLRRRRKDGRGGCSAGPASGLANGRPVAATGASHFLPVAALPELTPALSQAAYKVFTALILEHNLLREFAQPLLALQVEQDAALRHLLAGVLVEAVTRAGELMPAVMATATSLTRV